MLHQVQLTPTQKAAKDVRARLKALRAPEPKSIPIQCNDKPQQVPVQRAPERAMHNLLAPQPAEKDENDAIPPPQIADILAVVSKFYNVSRLDIISERRHADIVLPRQVVMYLARHMTLKSLPQIGLFLGGRDHTTILHGVCKLDKMVATDAVFAAQIEVMKAKILERQLTAFNRAMEAAVA